MTIQALQTALSVDPSRDDLRIQLGDGLLRLGEFEQALACFDACRPPSDILRRAALFGAALALQKLGRFEESAAFYLQVLALDPCAGEALSNLIAMHVELFDLTRVELYSLRLLETNAESTIALQGLALVAIERGEYPNASRLLARIGNPAPDPEESDSIEYRLSHKVLGRIEAAQARRGSR